MQRKSEGIIQSLTRVRKAFKSDDPVEELIDQIVQDRAILLLDHVAQFEVETFTKQWIHLNSPPHNYARGRAVLDFLVRFRSRFLLLDFHPDNLEKLWTTIRSSDNPSILQFVVELTTHFRLRVIAQKEELMELTEHLASGFTFIHQSDRRLIDSVVEEDDMAVVDEQFFDELPTVEEIADLITANSWMVSLLYCHRFSSEFFDELNELTLKQTLAAEKRAKEVSAAPTAPRDEAKA